MATLTLLDATHGFTTGDLDTSGQFAVVPAYQKVYFADGRPWDADITLSGYHKLDFINTRIETTADPGWTKGDVVTQLHGGGDPSFGIVDEIIERTTGVYWILIYRTTAVEFTTDADIDTVPASTTLALATITGVVAPPHWLNWTPTLGTFPDGGSNVMALMWGRIFMNSLSSPHQWFATRINDPLDLLLVVDDVASATNSQTSGQTGLVGDQLIALISHKDNMGIFGCLNKMFVMRADPQKGGFFATLSDTTGIFSNTSWCWDDKNNFYWLGNDGLYVSSYDAMVGSPPSPPTNLTKEHLPKLVTRLALNRGTDRVTMAYDKDRYGIEVIVSQQDGLWHAAFWVDLRTGGVFPEKYVTGQIPASLFYYDAKNKDDRTLLAGGYDGYIRTWDEAVKSDDDDEPIESYAIIGPLVGTEIRGKIKLNELSVKTGIDTDRLSIGLYAAITAEQLIKDIQNGEPPKVSKDFTVDKLLPSLRQSVMDGAIGIMLSNNTADSSWGIEKIDANLAETGRVK